MSVPTGFWEKVDVGLCWEWTGPKVNGYGRFRSLGGGSRRVHRIAYEALVGPIPDGLVLDHLCRNRACVNPDHMEAVTQRENVRRGVAGHHMREKSAAITACPQGHEYTPENARINKQGARECRQCNRDRCKKRRQKEAGR